MNNNTCRILAEAKLRNNNTWETGLNNNDVIIGPSGAGKTRSYVKPNILQGNESMIITDTKGSLQDELAPIMRKKGYKVIQIDFTDCCSSYGYNPFDNIRYDEKREKYVEQDILTIAACLIPLKDTKDPFWDLSARMYVECLIGYTLECLPKCEHNLESVVTLFDWLGTKEFDQLFYELEEQNPKSFALKRYKMFQSNRAADKMHESIKGIIAENLSTLTFDDVNILYHKGDRICFENLAKEKTIVFLKISDLDRSMDKLANLFYTQALQVLCNSADRDYPTHRLPIPVRFILDDFAANVYIPDFDKIISVIRSREIYVSIILQSISQLEALYGHEKSITILNNCDNCLYLGGQDVETAKYMSVKANKSINTILNMPLQNAWLFTRGVEPEIVKKFNVDALEL